VIKDFGGKGGVRDENLLLSSVGQPQQTFGGNYLYDTIFKMAACYLFSFAKNHAFFDGNKRVALKTCYHFLDLNRYETLLTNDEFCELVLGCVNDRYSIDEIAKIIEENVASWIGIDSQA